MMDNMTTLQLEEQYFSFSQAAAKLDGIIAIDYFFAKELVVAILLAAKKSQGVGLNKEQQTQLFHLFIALNISLRAGHSCLILDELATKRYFVSDEKSEPLKQGFIFANIETLTSLLLLLPLTPNDQQPLVFIDQRLYLRRYFLFEQELKTYINVRQNLSSTQNEQVLENKAKNQRIKTVLIKLFPQLLVDKNEIDWQAVAVANAINKNFCIIAGGPGTGKTYTVTKLLAALLMLNKDSTPRISLVAPTGKAAQRLSESIIKAVAGFDGMIAADVLQNIPQQAQTIHRLLGVIPDQVNFRHHQDNLLPVDILLIDEVSMVDLPMMVRIFRALPSQTKVIMLGDADQLPSVAVGSVLADLAPRPHQGYSEVNHAYLSEVTGMSALPLYSGKFSSKESLDQVSHVDEKQYTMSDSVTFLLKSRRFDGEGEIGKIATQVISGDYAQSWRLLLAAEKNNSKELYHLANDIHSWLTPLVEQYYQPLFSCKNVEDAFKQFAQFRILSATRKGPQGVEIFNEYVLDILQNKGLVPYNRAFFPSQPILITENDYKLGIYNGDIGIFWRNQQGILMAVFEMANGDYQWIMPSRLPSFEHVYAMTIHKTQGSEFMHVAMVLPEQKDNKLLSRELLYTGITRAKSKLSIASNEYIWRSGVSQKIQRFSGLTDNMSC